MMNAIPKGFEQITDLSAVTGLTVPDGANIALIQAESQDIRWRDDGTDPTATVGALIKSSATEAFVYGNALGALKLIAASAGATANVTYYRR